MLAEHSFLLECQSDLDAWWSSQHPSSAPTPYVPVSEPEFYSHANWRVIINENPIFHEQAVKFTCRFAGAIPVTHLVGTGTHQFSNKRVTGLQQHLRLDHVHHERIRYIQKNKLATGLENVQLGIDRKCDSCALGKSFRKHVPHSSDREISTKPLELVHMDTLSVDTPDHKGRKYALIIVDDYTRMCWVYLMKSKSETLKCVQDFDLNVATRHNLKIGKIRSDNGSEFKNRKMIEFTARRQILLDYSPVYTPELNGVAERMMRTLMNTTRSKLFHSQLPKAFWSSALVSAAYVRNIVGPAKFERTPYEMFTRTKPDYSHLRIFGSPAFVHIDPRANLADHKSGDLNWRAYPAIFIGYAPDTPAWLFWDVKAGKIRSASYFHATIMEQANTPASTYFKHHSVNAHRDSDSTEFNGSIDYRQFNNFDTHLDEDEHLDEIQMDLADLEALQQPVLDPVVNEPSQDGLQHLFGMFSRTIKSVEHLVIPACLTMLDKEPKHFRHAVRGLDADTWWKSMDEEMQSHYDCGTFTLVTCCCWMEF
eukprot:g691.t1